jgi:subtilisin family serine protease
MLKNIVAIIFVFTALLFAEDWTFLDVQRSGAEKFIKDNPKYDGSGVVIFILDTGVDMGVPGLKELPDGSVKVIDVQDFSGEGDLFIGKADTASENGEKYLHGSYDYKLFGYDKIKYSPLDSVYYIGVLKEEHFVNSIIPDINNNGKKNDQYGVLVFKSSDGWLAYVDLDGDGNVEDEQPIWNYKEKHQSFTFRGRNKKYDKNLATFALNIFPKKRKVSFHFDGAAHGTHVAGIAAGYKIHGQDGFNGVAPGAKIISCKLGNGRLAGGATTTGSMLKAFEYVMDFAEEYDGPVVVNMSFGVGSEIEGASDMADRLDRMLKGSKVVACLSAGNEGPGISTIGLPAAADRVLTVGALLTAKNARDNYGASLKDDKVFSFSSRGGELNKPDIIAPGSASSTVPPFSSGDRMWGTSMASPNASGAVALILSAAYQQKPALPINNAILKKAVKNSADRLKGYNYLDQGAGIINVPLAFEYYKKYIKRGDEKSVNEYEIDTVSPIYETENGQAAYWRFGDYFPTVDDKQRFYINAIFPKDFSKDDKQNFFRGFNLYSTAPWLKVNNKSIYLKGTKSAKVDVWFDKEKLKQSGLYNGKIMAYRKGGNKREDVEFELMCSAVVPQKFEQKNSYTKKIKDIRIAAGDVKRIFLDIPIGASSMVLKFKTSNYSFSKIRAYLMDPKGIQKGRSVSIDSEKGESWRMRVAGDKLSKGTWELDLYASFNNSKKSGVDVEIAFGGLKSMPEVIDYISYEQGENPRGKVEISNLFYDKVQCKVGGKISGFQKNIYVDDNSDNYEYSFTVDDRQDKVVFDIEVSAETFNLFTDFAINIKDYSGKDLEQSGLSYCQEKIIFAPPASGEYILELLPAFASKTTQDWQAVIKESYYLFQEIEIGGVKEDFYPKVTKNIEFELGELLPVAPQGYYLFGELWLDSIDKKHFRTIIPIQLETGIND